MVPENEHFVIMHVYVSPKATFEIHVCGEELWLQLLELVRPSSVEVMIFMDCIDDLLWIAAKNIRRSNQKEQNHNTYENRN